MQQMLNTRKTAVAIAVGATLTLGACGGSDGGGEVVDTGIDNSIAQPVVSARVKSILTV